MAGITVLAGLFLLLHTVCLTTGAPSVNMDMNPNVISVGDDVAIECQFSALTSGLLLRLERYNEARSQWQVLVTNTNKDMALERYTFSTTPHDFDDDPTTPDFLMTFQITGALSEDSGEYRCSLNTVPDVTYAEESLAIIAPAEEVTLMYVNDSGEEMDMANRAVVLEDVRTSIGVICEVSGPSAHTHVDVTLGDKDITDYFTATSTTVHFEGQSSLAISETTARLVAEAIPVSYFEHNSANLTCNGRSAILGNDGEVILPDANSPIDVSSRFTLQFDLSDIAPEFDCPDMVRSYNYHTHVNITCSLLSIPAPDEVNVRFEELGEDNITVELGTHHDMYSLHMNNEEDGITVTFIIDRAFGQDFRNYSFYAHNSAGDATDTVQLIVALASRTVMISLSSSRVYVGDSVTITCQVTSRDTEGQSPSLVMHWMKRVPEHESDIDIGANMILNDGFKDRYVVSNDIDPAVAAPPPEMSFYLTIDSVTSQDSGEFGCKIDSIEVFKTLDVLVDVESLEFGSTALSGDTAETFQNNTEYNFTEGEAREFFCRVNGAYPLPEVQVFLGGNDITDSFDSTEQLVSDGSILGFKGLTYNVELRNPSLTIDYNADNQRLECRAKVPGESTFDDHSVGIQIDLTGYKPKFKCDAEMDAKVYTSMLNITCLAVADPPLNITSIYWYSYDGTEGSEGNDTEAANGRKKISHAKGYIPVVEHGKSDAETHMSLIVKKVYKQHFRTYYFEASNALGTTTHAITLVENTDLEYTIDGEDNTTEKIINESPVSTNDVNSGLSLSGSMAMLTLLLMVTVAMLR